MATRKENLKSLFVNSRTRIIIIVTAVLLIITVLIGVIKFRSADVGPGSRTTITTAPAIQSIPGSPNPTAEYVKLQEAQNIQEANQALKTGGSAIPTIIKTQAFGEGVQPIGPPPGQGGVGFSTLTREEQEGALHSEWLNELQTNHCDKTTVAQVRSAGAQLGDLKAACSCTELKDVGLSLTELQQICSCRDLKAAGFSAAQLKENGYSAGQLRLCGFSACELKNAGFTAQDMKDGGFNDDELRGAGYPDSEIFKSSALPSGLSVQDVQKADCQADSLSRLRQAGVSAASIRRINGCNAATLKAAGYTASDLKNAGFNAAELKKAGFTPADLRQAGFGAGDLLNADWTPDDLSAAGFTPGEISAALARLPVGISPADVKAAGCDVNRLEQEREQGVSAKLIRQYAGCTAQALKAAGFDDSDLANAGFTPDQISAVKGITGALGLKDCSENTLQTARAQGVTATKIRQELGCSPADLKAAGFNAKNLKDAGFSAAELKNAGLSAADLKAAGYGPRDLSDAGFSPQDLKNAGFTASQLKNAGFSAQDLKNLGYSAQQLKDAGFSPQDLKNAGFSAGDLKAAGLNAVDLKNAGFTAADLKNAGFSALDLRNAGYSPKQLQDAGYTDSDLAAAGLAVPGSDVTGLGTPTVPGVPGSAINPITAVPGIPTTGAGGNTQQLQDILKRQNQQLADQRFQQAIQTKTAGMMSAANQDLQIWQRVSVQTYTGGGTGDARTTPPGVISQATTTTTATTTSTTQVASGPIPVSKALIKTGDIVFAVLDTAVNSDEPGPILATVVSGRLKGAKLIGSFTLPSNASKMVISFNTMSVPGAPKSTSINAYAIDPNTARTALASSVDHHYFLRYGSLFASSFLEGFGNAFQSANTSVTIGGTGGGDNITIQNGVGRSALENAVIGLATVGKYWGQQAQQIFNTPVTVYLCAGTPLGILFTQDLLSL